MHGLQPVARIGQARADDHAHRIVEIGAFQLVLDGDGIDAEPAGGGADGGVSLKFGSLLRPARTPGKRPGFLAFRHRFG